MKLKEIKNSRDNLPFFSYSYSPVKGENLMDFWGSLWVLKNPVYASQISLLTKQPHFICLSVLCSFAPSPHKYKSILWGPLLRIFRFCRKSRISPFLTYKTMPDAV